MTATRERPCLGRAQRLERLHRRAARRAAPTSRRPRWWCLVRHRPALRRRARSSPGVDEHGKDDRARDLAVAGIDAGGGPCGERVRRQGPPTAARRRDASVIRAIQDLRARGLEVVFYPFVLMDIPRQCLADPMAAEQAPIPGGRIHMPWHRDGRRPRRQVARRIFVGTATSIRSDGMGLPPHRSCITRNLCASAGGVDAFLIGSELRGLTTLRSTRHDLSLRCRAGDARRRGEGDPRPGGEGHLCRRLERVFRPPAAGWHAAMCSSISIRSGPSPPSTSIGIDNYMPLSDWRDGSRPSRPLAAPRLDL